MTLRRCINKREIKRVLTAFGDKVILTSGDGPGPTTSSNTNSGTTLLQLLTLVYQQRQRWGLVGGGNGSPIRGHLVGFHCPPTRSTIVNLLTLWSMGAIAVPIAPQTPIHQLRLKLESIQCQHFLVLERSKDGETQSIPRLYSGAPLNQRVQDQDTWDVIKHQEYIDHSSLSRSEAIEFAAQILLDLTSVPSRPLLCIFTSGSTGVPKGVLHTIKTIHASVSSLSQEWCLSSRDVCYHALPLHHIHGLVNALLAVLYNLGTVHLLPKNSASDLWQRWISDSYSKDEDSNDPFLQNGVLYPVRDKLCTPALDPRQRKIMMGVPTMYAKLAEVYHQASPLTQSAYSTALMSFREFFCGSAPLSPRLFATWHKICGKPMLERYGMTETGMILGHSAGLYEERVPGRVGHPFPGVRVKLLPIAKDLEEGVGDLSSNLPGTKVGELCVAGDQVFPRYLNVHIERTLASDFTSDGYFRTGDLAEFDPSIGGPKGSFRILGRLSVDIIKSGGYKISGLEVERAIEALGILSGRWRIRECAVLGIPDPIYGQVVACVLFVQVMRPFDGELIPLEPYALKEDATRQLAATSLTGYQIPRRWIIQQEPLPRNEMGKINKKTLVSLFPPV